MKTIDELLAADWDEGEPEPGTVSGEPEQTEENPAEPTDPEAEPAQEDPEDIDGPSPFAAMFSEDPFEHLMAEKKEDKEDANGWDGKKPKKEEKEDDDDDDDLDPPDDEGKEKKGEKAPKDKKEGKGKGDGDGDGGDDGDSDDDLDPPGDEGKDGEGGSGDGQPDANAEAGGGVSNPGGPAQVGATDPNNPAAQQEQTDQKDEKKMAEAQKKLNLFQGYRALQGDFEKLQAALEVSVTKIADDKQRKEMYGLISNIIRMQGQVDMVFALDFRKVEFKKLEEIFELLNKKAKAIAEAVSKAGRKLKR